VRIENDVAAFFTAAQPILRTGKPDSKRQQIFAGRGVAGG
jgi:hypothetical protein